MEMPNLWFAWDTSKQAREASADIIRLLHFVSKLEFRKRMNSSVVKGFGLSSKMHKWRHRKNIKTKPPSASVTGTSIGNLCRYAETSELNTGTVFQKIRKVSSMDTHTNDGSSLERGSLNLGVWVVPVMPYLAFGVSLLYVVCLTEP